MTDERANALLLMKARLHRELARAHNEYARGVARVAGEIEATDLPDLRGRIQRLIVGLPEMYAEAGVSAAEIAQQLDYDEANTYGVLKTLTESEVLEEVQGTKPRRWRMAVKHRRARVLRMSRLVPNGKWTTYGDFSIAVYDSVKMAITVGRVAAKNPAFVNPHRVLWSGGVIKDAWLDDEGRGPEECERRLRDDGVEVTDRVAEKAHFIGWEKLKELLEEDERATDADEEAA